MKTYKEFVAEKLPCWAGYKQLGMKTKNGKKVPNCISEEIEEEFIVSGVELYEEWGELNEESEKNGRKVKLNKPFLTPNGPKKRAVYVKNDSGNVVKVNFGDPNMEIKRDDPDRRASFRARHHCSDPGPKWKANYWSCRYWSNKSVSELDK